MAKTVICRLVTGNAPENGRFDNRPAAVLDIYRNSGGKPQRLIVCQTQTLKLNYGDRLKCISGKIVVVINPGTPAGAFVLLPDLPSCVRWNERTELEINDAATQHIHRGGISVMDDIGTMQAKTGGTTR